MKLKLPSLAALRHFAALRPFATAVALQSLVVLAALLVLLVPLAALAQAADPAQPDLGQLLAQALGVITTWKGGGALVGVIALTNLLTNATKLSALDGIFAKLWWLRPVLSLVFGVVSGILGGVAAGTPVVASVLAGLLAGLASTGFHELVQAFNEKTKTARVAGSAVVAVAASGDAAKVESMKASLDAASKITDEKERLAALAAWANANG